VTSVPAHRANGRPRKHPLILRWHQEIEPLPVRNIRGLRSSAPPAPPPPEPGIHLDTGPRDRPFDFCGHLRRLLVDVAQRCPQLGHVDMARVLLGVTQARSGRRHGLQARVTPLRFARGALTRKRRGATYQVQRYFLGDHEYLYLMTFCLPRFLDQEFDDKLVTVFHEMFHLSPACDGDLRRHNGRYHLHTHNQKGYDRHMLELARSYLNSRPEPRLHHFLRLNFSQLLRRHGAVHGIVVPRPKIIPLLDSVVKSAAFAQPPGHAALE
jgi:hypothetical protein